jgi:hypothetical protein
MGTHSASRLRPTTAVRTASSQATPENCDPGRSAGIRRQPTISAMHGREDSDRLSWTLSALVVVIMGLAVVISSRESSSAHDTDSGTPTAAKQPAHPESQAKSRSGTTRSPEPRSTDRAARL